MDADFLYDIVLDSAHQPISRRTVIADTGTTAASFQMTASKNQHTCLHHEAYILVGFPLFSFSLEGEVITLLQQSFDPTIHIYSWN